MLRQVSTVVKEVEIEARVVEAEVSGAVKGGAAEMEVVEVRQRPIFLNRF